MSNHEVPQPGQEPRADLSQLDVWMESRPRIGEAIISTGKKVYFLSMDGADYHRLILQSHSMPDAELVAMCICDEKGAKVFNDISHGIGVLQGRDSCDLRKVAMAILKHSKVPTNQKEAEEQEKKS